MRNSRSRRHVRALAQDGTGRVKFFVVIERLVEAQAMDVLGLPTINIEIIDEQDGMH